MSTTIPDLWPPDFGISKQPAPATILRQQAYLLGQRTRNFVTGEVISKTEPQGKFVHLFSLSAPLLDFQQTLFQVRHGVEFYPVEFAVYTDDGPYLATPVAADAEQFMGELKKQLANERIVRLIRSLVDQCRDPDESPEKG